VTRWRDRKDPKLVGRGADGVEVVLVVPKHLIDFIAGEQAGIVRDGTCAVEMEDLETAGAGDV